MDIQNLVDGMTLDENACFCGYCHQAYGEWFAGEHLIDALGTERHLLFRAMTYANFLKDAKNIALSKKRPVFLTFNGAGTEREPFYEMCDDYADVLNTEAHTPADLMTRAKFLGRDGRPFEVLSCSEAAWSHNALKPDSLVKLESAAAVIPGGTYTVGITRRPDGGLDEYNISRLSDIGRRLGGLEPYVRGAGPVYEAAVLGRTHLKEGNCSPRLGANILSDAGISRVLRKHHVLNRIIRRTDELPEYSAVIIPSFRKVSPGEKEEIMKYVEAGGNIFVESPSAAEYDGGPLMFGELAGIKKKGIKKLGERKLHKRSIPNACYLKLKGKKLSEDMPENMYIFCESEEVCLAETAGAEELASLHFEFMPKARTSDIQNVPNVAACGSDFPGITVNSFGKGTAVFSSVPLFFESSCSKTSSWNEALAQNVITYLLGGSMFSVPGFNKVEIFAARKKNSLLLHFLNHNYGPGENLNFRAGGEKYKDVFVEISPRLAEKTGSIELKPDSGPLEMISREGRRGFVLPELGVHALAEIRVKP